MLKARESQTAEDEDDLDLGLAGDDQDGADEQGAGDDQDGADDQGAGDDQDGTDDQGAGDDQVDQREAGSQQPDQGRSRSRGDRRVETLLTRDDENKRQIADLNRRLDEALASRSQQPAETPEQRETRLALLTPEERMEARLNESLARQERMMQANTVQTQDVTDKSSFDAKATVDPLYAKWAPKVEGKLAELRAKGQNVGREALLKYLIGEHALAGRKVGSGVQRRAAERRVAGQRTAPSNGRSDAPSQRRSQGNSLERRLENVPL